MMWNISPQMRGPQDRTLLRGNDFIPGVCASGTVGLWRQGTDGRNDQEGQKNVAALFTTRALLPLWLWLIRFSS